MDTARCSIQDGTNYICDALQYKVCNTRGRRLHRVALLRDLLDAPKQLVAGFTCVTSIFRFCGLTRMRTQRYGLCVAKSTAVMSTRCRTDTMVRARCHYRQ